MRHETLILQQAAEVIWFTCYRFRHEMGKVRWIVDIWKFVRIKVQEKYVFDV